MSLLDTRDQLYAALTAAGIETGARVPAVMVVPADPWITSAGVLDGSTQRITWRVTPVAGRTDADGSLALLADLIERTLPVIRGLPGWTRPQVAAPGPVNVGGVDYLGAGIDVTTLISTNGTGG